MQVTAKTLNFPNLLALRRPSKYSLGNSSPCGFADKWPASFLVSFLILASILLQRSANYSTHLAYFASRLEKL